jgi:hypothetical protein
VIFATLKKKAMRLLYFVLLKSRPTTTLEIEHSIKPFAKKCEISEKP